MEVVLHLAAKSAQPVKKCGRDRTFQGISALSGDHRCHSGPVFAKMQIQNLSVVPEPTIVAKVKTATTTEMLPLVIFR